MVSVVVVELLVLFLWVLLSLVLVAVVVVVGLSMLLNIGGQDVTREIGEAKKQSILAGQMLATLARSM